MAPHQTPEQFIAEISAPPAVGAPHGVPVPGTERPGRTPIYRHHLFRDRPLLTTIEPNVNSFHDMLELAIQSHGHKKALGVRPWNPATQEHENRYEWMTFAQMGERRKHIGAGIVEAVEKAGVTQAKYGVGIWSQNSPEWHLLGTYSTAAARARKPRTRVLAAPFAALS